MKKGGKEKSKKVTEEGRIKTNHGKILSKKRKTNAKSRKIRVREEEKFIFCRRDKKIIFRKEDMFFKDKHHNVYGLGLRSFSSVEIFIHFAWLAILFHL
jgi:hypothetical protein